MIGIGTLWFSVFIGGFVIPDGQFGAWTHSLSQYTTVSGLVYYQPIRTLIPIGFSIANFGALVALAEGWRRWEKDDSRDLSQYKLISLFTIVALSVLMIPILDVVTTPSYLNALGAWGLTFLLIVIGLSASYSLFEAYRNGSGLGRLPSLFLLPMWGTLVIAGSFWVEASLSFARIFRQTHPPGRKLHIFFVCCIDSYLRITNIALNCNGEGFRHIVREETTNDFWINYLARR